MKKLIEYLPDFCKALTHQLTEDEKRWGDTWKQRGRDGQEERFISWLQDKIDQYRNAGVPLPWLKIAGEALIGWVRETQGE